MKDIKNSALIMAVMGSLSLAMSARPFELQAASSREGCLTDPSGLKLKVRVDNFTKMLYFTDEQPAADNDKAQIQAAWDTLLRPQTHCAMRLVASAIAQDRVGVVFQPTRDDLAEYDYSRKEIQINNFRLYLRSNKNLPRLMYHEGLHHLEYRYGLRRLDAPNNFHDPANIKNIVQKLEKSLFLFGGNEKSACSSLVREDGALMRKDGSLVEPSFERARSKEYCEACRSFIKETCGCPDPGDNEAFCKDPKERCRRFPYRQDCPRPSPNPTPPLPHPVNPR